MSVDPYIQALLDSPIGGDHLKNAAMCATQEAREVARRASKIWLPNGKRSANTTEARDAAKAAKALNYDLEDAVEQAGGNRGAGSR